MNAEPKKPAEQNAAQSAAPSEMEIVDNIAVKDPTNLPQAGSPSVPQAQEPAPPAQDKELDGILKQVNQDVKTDKKSYLESAQQTAGSIQAAKKQSIWGGKLKAALPIVLALVVAVGLSATAVYAFSKYQQDTPAPHDSAEQSAESDSTEEESAVTTQSVSSFAESMGSELEALDDSQEFGQENLSDSTLGL